MNLFAFTGNLGKGAETRQAGSSTVCSFSVAVQSGYGDKQTTTWVRCNLWGKRAEGKLPGYLTTGQQVAITGELSNREYEKDGQKRYSLEVNVNSLDLIGKAGESKPAQNAPASDNSGGGSIEDDIPFAPRDHRRIV